MDSLLKLKEEIKKVVEAQDLVLYDVVWTQEGSMKILQVSILDKSGKMDIDTCAVASGVISERLDVLDLIAYEYYLEVCSPGAERELRDETEIKAAVGENVYVKLKEPRAGLDEVYGTLVAVNDATIVVSYRVKTAKKKVEIDVDNIKTIRLSVII